MSELKSVYIDRTGDWCRSGNDTGKFYLKSEADKVIAELKDKALQYKVLNEEHCRDLNTQERFFAEQIAELNARIADGDKDFEMANNQNERLLKIVRHQKYKRCLAIVKYCDMGLTYYNEKLDSFSCERANFFYRWYNRWWKLAEKFKGGK